MRSGPNNMKMTDLIKEIERALEDWDYYRPSDEQGTTRDWNIYIKYEEKLKEVLDNAKTEAQILDKWCASSKHIACPCTWESSCSISCPHGKFIMSGVCNWCTTKFKNLRGDK